MHRTVVLEKSELTKMNPIIFPGDSFQTTAQKGEQGKARTGLFNLRDRDWNAESQVA